MDRVRAAMPEIGRERARGQEETHDALEALIARYERELVGYLTIVLRDRDQALDCAQETFLRAYQNLERGKPVSAAWLWTVGRNLAINEIRRRKRSGRLDDEAEHTASEGDVDGERVRRSLEALNPEDSEILYLFSVDRFRSEEIAAMLGIQAGTVRMRLVRARRRFRAAFEGTS